MGCRIDLEEGNMFVIQIEVNLSCQELALRFRTDSKKCTKCH